MEKEEAVVIKSFKHNGSVHRIWHKNWAVPTEFLHPLHESEQLCVFVNHGTQIQEADGEIWVNRTPGVTYFLPGMWFNVVALLEHTGVRYYCNISSPFYRYNQTVTYIDYDLDVIKYANGSAYVIDQAEYHRHRKRYQYSSEVHRKVKRGLQVLLDRVHQNAVPFDDVQALRYYELYKERALHGR